MRLRVPGVVAAALFAIGCFHHTYTTGNGAPTNGTPVYDKWHSHWVAGIVGDDNVDVKAVCPSGNATVTNDITFLNGLVGTLVGLVYYPSTVRVYCAETGPRGVEVSLSRQEALRLAMSDAFLEIVREMLPERAAEVGAAQAYQRPLQGGIWLPPP